MRSPGAQRRLLLIGFHRRMASSIPALAASLENVAARLRRLQAGQPSGRRRGACSDDLEDEDESRVSRGGRARGADRSRGGRRRAGAGRELRRPRPIAPARCQGAIVPGRDPGRPRSGARRRGSGKAVVFTESITTQEYLRTLLIESASRTRTSPCSAAPTITRARSRRTRAGSRR